MNVLDDSGRSAIHWCAIFDISGVAKVLLNTQPVKVNQRSASGNMPLVEAAFSGAVTVIDCLVQSGADMEFRSLQDLTALEIAVSSRHLQTAVKLIKLGSQVEVRERSILQLAVKQNVTNRISIARELLNEFPSKLGAD